MGLSYKGYEGVDKDIGNYRDISELGFRHQAVFGWGKDYTGIPVSPSVWTLHITSVP